MDLNLKGLSALITGSSSGLGFATAALLAQEGCRVAINGRDQHKLSQAVENISQQRPAEVIGLVGDLSDPIVPEKLVRDTIAKFSGLDILITNAGGPPAGPFESFNDLAWQQAVEINFLSQMRLVRAALPFLRKSKYPSVLTITSYSVKQPIPNLILSNSVRAATIGLTKSLALELGDQGIRFNSILPGATDTERIQNLMRSRAKANNTSVNEEINKQVKEIPLGRLATPEEFARAAVFLVSPAASYITGVMLQVDGGIIRSTI
jgi:3-oxoacyl-[acyl-carrier protein] reductase